ncbi:6-carboxytetrahydropterin synthase [bacterium]|nr:6-carboxytetrahydropterin synthase [candidate division CSSED10-310 bacterium]
MIEIIIGEFCFSASHKLTFENGSGSNIHGHEWHLTVFVRSLDPDETGISINYQLLRDMIQEQVDRLNRKFLNDLPIFAGKNPTDEMISKVLFQVLSEKINSQDHQVCAVEIWHSGRRHIKYSREVCIDDPK